VSEKELLSRNLEINVRKSGVTDKELCLAARVAEGLKNVDIARNLGTTENTIKCYLKALYDKLGLWNRVELALWYVKQQWEASQVLAKG
jgi:DNA-binding NarL/FixJ family response regulator